MAAGHVSENALYELLSTIYCLSEIRNKSQEKKVGTYSVI